MTIIGYTFYGPHRYVFYNFINPFYSRYFWKWGIIAKEGIVQGFFRSIFDVTFYGLVYIPLLFMYTGLIKKFDVNEHPIKQIPDLWMRSYTDLKRQYWTAYWGLFGFYGVLMGLMYAYVPQFFRPTCSACASIIWAIIHSYITHNI